MDWVKLIFGVYNRKQVLDAVDDTTWQNLRIRLKGTSMEYRYKALQHYLGEEPEERKKIQVTNYVYALKRGGLWK